MGKTPEADVDLLLRASYDADANGEVAVKAGVEAPLHLAGASAEIVTGWSRHWTSIGDGELVLRISRPGTATAAAMLESAKHGHLAPVAGPPTSAPPWFGAVVREALAGVTVDLTDEREPRLRVRRPPEPPTATEE